MARGSLLRDPMDVRPPLYDSRAARSIIPSLLLPLLLALVMLILAPPPPPPPPTKLTLRLPRE